MYYKVYTLLITRDTQSLAAGKDITILYSDELEYAVSSRCENSRGEGRERFLSSEYRRESFRIRYTLREITQFMTFFDIFRRAFSRSLSRVSSPCDLLPLFSRFYDRAFRPFFFSIPRSLSSQRLFFALFWHVLSLFYGHVEYDYRAQMNIRYSLN